MDKNMTARRKAQQLARDGMVGRAIDEMEQVLQAGETDPYDYVFQGDLMVRAGRTDDGVAAYDEAISAYERVGLYRNAIAISKKVLRTAPGRVRTHWRLGDLFAKEGLIGDAVSHFLTFLDQGGGEASGEEFLETLERVAQISGARVEVTLRLAELYARAGHEDRAARLLNEVADAASQEGGFDIALQLRERANQLSASDSCRNTEATRAATPEVSASVEFADPFGSAYQILPEDDVPSDMSAEAPIVDAPSVSAAATAPSPAAAFTAFEPNAPLRSTAGNGDLEADEPASLEDPDHALTFDLEDETTPLSTFEPSGFEFTGGGFTSAKLASETPDITPGFPDITPETPDLAPEVSCLTGPADEATVGSGDPTEFILTPIPDDPDAPDDPRVPEVRSALVSGEWGAVRLLCEEMHESHPDSPWPLEKLIAAVHQLGDTLAMVRYLTLLGDLRINREDLEGALGCFLRVIELEPRNATARRRLARFREMGVPGAEQVPEAVHNSVQELIETKGATVAVRDQGGVASEEWIDLTALLQEFRDGVRAQFGPEDIVAHYDLGLSHQEMGLYEEAIEEFDFVLASAGAASDVVAKTREMRGLCLERLERMREAIFEYRAALEVPDQPEPCRTPVRYSLANVLEIVGDIEEARRIFQDLAAAAEPFLDSAERAGRLEERAA